MANPTFYIKRNDTLPNLDVALSDDRGRPTDLSSISGVVFNMRSAVDNSAKISGTAASVLDASRGEVRYAWSASDTDTSGTYEGEFQVTFSNGDIQTFPDDGFIQVIIEADVS